MYSAKRTGRGGINLPECRPAACSCTRSCPPRCSAELPPAGWKHRNFPPLPLPQKKGPEQRGRERKREGEKEGGRNRVSEEGHRAYSCKLWYRITPKKMTFSPDHN